MDREEEIRIIAYRIWEEEGCPHGCDVEHWTRAEIIWSEQQKPEAAPAIKSRTTRPASAAAKTSKNRERKGTTKKSS